MIGRGWVCGRVGWRNTAAAHTRRRSFARGGCVRVVFAARCGRERRVGPEATFAVVGGRRKNLLRAIRRGSDSSSLRARYGRARRACDDGCDVCVCVCVCVRRARRTWGTERGVRGVEETTTSANGSSICDLSSRARVGGFGSRLLARWVTGRVKVM